MSRITEINDKLDIDDFVRKVESLDTNSPNLKKNYLSLLDEYAEKITNIIKDESIEIIVAILDAYFNFFPTIARRIVSSGNESIIRAQLVLENIKGISPITIKDNLKSAESMYTLYAMNFGLVSNKIKEMLENGQKIDGLLHEYLQGKDNKQIEEIVNNDTLEFYKNIKKVDGFMFPLSETRIIPLRTQYIMRLFKLENIDDETLSKIYNEVLLKNSVLENFDYSSIIEDDIMLITRVKGLYQKSPSFFFDSLADDRMIKSRKDYKELVELLNMIVKLNIDDKTGLIMFFREFTKREYKCPKLIQYFKKNGLYNDYFIDDFDKLYEDCVTKLLNGDINIDEYLIKDLGSSKAFKDNFEKLIDCFDKSNDTEYQRFLIIPLAVAYAEIRREKFNLDFTIETTSKVIGANTLGYYDDEENKLFYNPFYAKCVINVKDELACAFNTINHEVKHARQFKEINESSKLSFDNLIMAMDLYFRDDTLYSYYKTNYRHISYERDARACAYAETKELLRNHPDLTKNLKPENISDYPLSDFIRKRNILSISEYYGIITLFEQDCNLVLSNASDEESLEYYKNKMFKYPVVKEFYDYDEANHRIVRKSEEYFNNKLQELDNKQDSIEKREAIFSINAFKYAIKVSDYLTDMGKMVDNDLNNEYSNDLIEEVINNVGSKPCK